MKFKPALLDLSLKVSPRCNFAKSLRSWISFSVVHGYLLLFMQTSLREGATATNLKSTVSLSKYDSTPRWSRVMLSSRPNTWPWRSLSHSSSRRWINFDGKIMLMKERSRRRGEVRAASITCSGISCISTERSFNSSSFRKQDLSVWKQKAHNRNWIHSKLKETFYRKLYTLFDTEVCGKDVQNWNGWQPLKF